MMIIVSELSQFEFFPPRVRIPKRKPWIVNTAPVTLKRKLSRLDGKQTFRLSRYLFTDEKMDTEPLPRSLQSFTLVLSRFQILAKSLFSGLSTPKKILARNEVEKFATLHTFSSVAWNIHTADLCYGSLQASFSGKGKQSWPLLRKEKLMFCRQNRTQNCAMLLTLPGGTLQNVW